MKSKTTEELECILGFEPTSANSLSMQSIVENVPQFIQPQIKAAFELYKRGLEVVKAPVLNKASAVLKVVRPMLSDLEHEEVYALMVDRALHLIKKVKISSGSISSCLIDVNGIARQALLARASGVILAHNHPSGSAEPGEEDIKQTAVLKNALKLIDVTLIDHVIVAYGGHAYSFADEKFYHNVKKI